VWLRARPETLARRVGSGADRPLLNTVADASEPGGPATVLARLDQQRRGLYEEVAAVVIDVDDLAPAAVAERVLDAVGPSRREQVR
jgi:shikimate kinase